MPSFPPLGKTGDTNARPSLGFSTKPMVFEEPVTLARKYMELERQLMRPPPRPGHGRRKPAAHKPAVSRLGKPSDALDGFAIIESAGLADPQDVTEATVTNKGFRRVNEHDARYFVNLNYLVADDNLLTFGDLGCFGALQELQLRCNRLTTVACPPGSFKSLVSLDVSFNQIDAQTLPHLGGIPTLHSLNLASNGITELTNGLVNLPNITRLVLDGNRLTQNAIQKLTLMPKLQRVDLASNGLVEFSIGASSLPFPQGTFPCLTHLNLAGNNIEDERDIQACGAIRSLQHLVVWGNPMADSFIPGMPTNSVLPGRSDVEVLCVDPLAQPFPRYQLHGPAYGLPPQMARIPQGGLHMPDRPVDAARNLRELLDMSATPEPEPDEAPSVPTRAFKGAAAVHGGFAGSSRPLINRGPRRGQNVFRDLRTSLISSSTSLYDGRPDPQSWRTTKAMENRRGQANAEAVPGHEKPKPDDLPDMRF